MNSGLDEDNTSPSFWGVLFSGMVWIPLSHKGIFLELFSFSSTFPTPAFWVWFSAPGGFALDLTVFPSSPLAMIWWDWSLGWDFLIGVFEAPLSLLPFLWIPLVGLLDSWFRRGLWEARGLKEDPLSSKELFVKVVELLRLPSFGDIARVVGIYKN